MFRKRRERKRQERVREDLEQARLIVSEIDGRNASGTDEEVLAWGSPRFGDADLLLTKYLPSGGNRRTAVQGDDPGEESTLRQNTNYPISLLNAGADTQVHAQFLWYELDYGQ